MIITTHADLAKAVDYFLAKGAFTFDVETVPIDKARSDDRGDPLRNRVSWISMATEGLAISVPFNFPNGDFVRLDFPLTPSGEKRVAEGKAPLASSYSKDERKAKRIFTEPPPHLYFDDHVVEILEPLFFSDREKINHNLKFDLRSIAKHFGGRIPPPPYFDTMVAAFILDVRNKGHLDLASCCARELDYKMIKGVGKEIEKHSFHEVGKYAFLDARYTWILGGEYKRQIDEQGIDRLMRLEMDVLKAVVDMEQTGAPIDPQVLMNLDKQFRERLEEIQGEVFRIAGRPFNIASKDELRQVLYTPKREGGRGLRTSRLTPGGKARKAAGEKTTYKDYSTDQKALESLRGKDEIVDLLLEWSDKQKLISSFTTPYIGGDVVSNQGGKVKVTTKDALLVNGRIHASFNQTGTDDGKGAETGRFSSSNPNLQQVPARSAEGKMIRSAFIAGPGMKLVRADYSQIEPRILADQSGDPRLVSVYLEGGDIYTTLADPFGLDRDAGKVMFLSIAYGTGPDTLAAACGLTIDEAKEIIYEAFPKEFPSVPKLKRAVIASAKRRNPVYVQTLLGRRRYLPELYSSDMGKRRRAERQAFNTFIQGTAADINKIGLVRTHRMVTPLGAMPILTVHDETVVLTPEEHAEEVASLLREAMEGASLLKVVPLVADVNIVDNWSQAK